MANKRHPKRLTQWEIIKLFRSGVYQVDVEEGVIYGRNGQALKPRVNHDDYLAIRIYDIPGCRQIAVHRLIWMIATGKPIPVDFEVHHKDGDITNNGFENLFCLHWLDHRKLHGGGWMIEEEEAPF